MGRASEDPANVEAAILERAVAHAHRWLESVPGRRVPATGTADDAAARLGVALPTHGRPATEVIDELAAAVEPGLMANASGRFFGWVMGSSLPSALAADWLVSAWDQNAGMRDATPGVVGVEEVAAAWLLELLGLPERAAVGFVTGATMANFTCLAAARDRVLRRVGWDVAADGLACAPRVRVLVGAEGHGSVDLALRYLGLGTPEKVAVDDQGRLDPDDLRRRLVGATGSVIVCLQAGNIHSGAFDPMAAAVDVARSAGAWVHVDGAFGLWAAVVPALAPLTAGMAGADSWATDAHKTLNTPYDCGIAIVRDPAPLRAAFSVQAHYFINPDPKGDPFDKGPELS